MKKKKLLITGLSSDLMQEFTKCIDMLRYEVIGLSRKSNPPYINGVSWIKGSLEDLYNLTRVLVNIDVVIHAAAITHTRSHQEYIDVNYLSTKKLVDSCNKSGVEKFVFISSRTSGIDSGAYGKSKYLAENYIKANYGSWMIFRPAEVFGMQKNEGIEDLINKVFSNKIHFSPKGGEKLYPISMTDTAKIIHEYLFKRKVLNETLTINGNRGFKHIDLIKFIAKTINKKIWVISIPKWVMHLLKHTLQIINLRVGIVPDQIDRFYAEKDKVGIDYDFQSLESYVISKKNIVI